MPLPTPLIQFAVASLAFAVLSGCTGACTTDAPPSFDITVSHDSLTEINATCLGQVISTETGTDLVGYINKATYSPTSNTCQYRSGNGGGNYSLSIKLQGYEPLLIEDIKVESDSCHAITEYQEHGLTPASTNCHDGYEWINNECQTQNGCPFPQLEQDLTSGDASGESTVSCVNRCIGIVERISSQPEAPGICGPAGTH